MTSSRNTVAQIIQQRRKTLLNGFVHFERSPPLVIVEDPSALGQLTRLEEFQPDERELNLGRRNPGKVVVRHAPGQPPETASLWVAAGYSGYRSAYRAFLKQVYGLDFARSVLSGYDVDHLLNRARAPLGNDFIRIEAIPSAVNQQWGAILEKAAGRDNNRSRRTMSWFIAAKLAGCRAPHGSDDRAAIDEIVRSFVAMGMQADMVRNGITSMLRFVDHIR